MMQPGSSSTPHPTFVNNSSTTPRSTQTPQKACATPLSPQSSSPVQTWTTSSASSSCASSRLSASSPPARSSASSRKTASSKCSTVSQDKAAGPRSNQASPSTQAAVSPAPQSHYQASSPPTSTKKIA